MRVLLIEDDIRLAESVKFQLEKEGFTVDHCEAGDDGLQYALEQAHDLILLEMRGKKVSTPVILLTALGELGDKIQGLDAGADDYLVKPFAFGELLARIRSISRRPQTWEQSDALRFGDLQFFPSEKRLEGPAGSCELSKREADLLECFLKNPGQTLPRSTLLLRVWGPDADVEDGNLDNYIHFLRRRLRSLKSGLCFATARGIGYRLEKK